MRSSRKRSAAELDTTRGPEEVPLLDRIRAVRIPEDFDVELLEAECLRPQSTVLRDVGLALLKFVSSHRGLTPEIFDEYARRQYVTRNPSQNPFGTDEVPAAFNEFDAFTKIRVLQQLTQWVMMNPTRIRERMEEQRDVDQASWRIEPYGWDREDRTYFVLDDNRIYRLTEAPPPQARAKPKKKSRKPYRQGRRSSKRQQIAPPSAEDPSPSDEAEAEEHVEVDDGLGGMKWECIAVTLEDVHRFLQTLQHSRDENEKILRAQIQEHLVPILQQQEDSRRKKALQRERDLLNLAKMANAKRSSRIAGRLEQQQREEQEREEERRRVAEAAATRRAEKQRLEMEKERESRLMSREARLKDRETRRLRYQEDLAQMSDESKAGGSQKRSSRQLQQAMEQRKEALQALGEAEDWVFDCICGVYGRVDDGTHSVACERCNVWQHSKCLGIAVEEAERPEFHFICASCRPRNATPNLQSREATEPLEQHAPPAGGQLEALKAEAHEHAPPAEGQLEAQKAEAYEHAPPAEGQLEAHKVEAHGQPSPSKPSLGDTDMAGGANVLTSPEQPPGDGRQIHSPAYSKAQESGIKPGQSPLATTSPLFNGTSAPSQASLLPGNAAHNGEPPLPPPSGGISPVKHAQNVPCETPSTTRSAGLDMSSTPALAPIAHPHIPTPPVKVSPPGVGQGHLDPPNGNLSPSQGP